jgi:hypothetical protein
MKQFMIALLITYVFMPLLARADSAIGASIGGSVLVFHGKTDEFGQLGTLLSNNRFRPCGGDIVSQLNPHSDIVRKSGKSCRKMPVAMKKAAKKKPAARK